MHYVRNEVQKWQSLIFQSPNDKLKISVNKEKNFKAWSTADGFSIYQPLDLELK